MQGRVKPSRWTALAISLAFTSIAAPAQAAPGDLDPAFSGDGTQATTFGTTPTGGPDQAGDAVAAPGGGYYVSGTTGGNVLLARYTAAGVLDTTFGGGTGLAFADAGADDRGDGITLDAANRPVIAGSSGDDFLLVRFTTAGALDASFSGDGMATADFGGGSDTAESVAALADGRVVAAGLAGVTGEDFGLAAFTATGDLDPAFGPGGADGDGRVMTDFAGDVDDQATDIIATGATLSVSGYTAATATPGDNGDFAVARYSATTGALDTTFSGDGKQTVDFNGAAGNPDFANAIAADSSGRLVLAGSAAVPSSNGDIGVARLTTGGALDSTFSTDGKTTMNFPSVISSDRGSSVAIDSAGNIVVGGGTGSESGNGVFLAARLTPAGLPDNTLDGDGFAAADPTPAGQDEAVAVIVDQPSGTITLAGTAASSSANANIAVARLIAASGNPDPAFGGGDGIVTTDVRSPTNSSETARAVANAPGGKIVVAGPTNVSPLDPDRGDFDFGVARYNADGTLDTGFGSGGVDGDGKVATNFTGGGGGIPGSDDDATAVAVQPDGKIVVAGFSRTNIAVARYTTAGQLDATFGVGGPEGDGKVLTDLGGAERERADAVIVQGTPGQPDFRIVVGGTKVESFGSNASFALVGYDEAGTPDGDFGAGGIVTTKVGPAGASADRIFDLAVQPDGKIVAAGELFTFSAASQQFALARYAADGGLDSTFSPGGPEGDGRVLTDFNGGFDSATAVAVRDLGGGALRIYAGGVASVGGTQAAIAADDAGGALDPLFSPGGTEGGGKAVYGPDSDKLYELELGPDGTVYGAGDLSDDQNPFGVLRTTALGAPDPAFGGGDGIVTTPVPGQAFNAPAQGLVLQPDGKPVAVGGNETPQQGSDLFLARYRVDVDPVVTPPGTNVPPTGPGTTPGTVDPAKPKCKKGQKLKKGKCVKKKRKKKKK